jgi:nucleoid-associated protein
MPIRHIIVHEVAKEPLEEVSTQLRDAENPVNDHAERVSTQLLGLFRGVSIGGFEQPEHAGLPLTGFEALLRNFFDSEDFSDFVAFSHGAAELLENKLSQPSAQQARGGYLLLNHYKHQDSDFLSVVLLRMRQGISLGDDLSFTEVDELNLDTLHMAARINLTEWLGGSGERYIVFKIGRQAREVTQYFADFIGCTEYTAAKLDTRKLVLATKQFCEQRNLGDADSNQAKKMVSEFCRDRADRQQAVLVEEVSQLLDTHYPPEDEGQQGMMLTIAQEDHGLTNRLAQIDKTALRSLVRYQGKTNKLSISFDADLLEQTVHFDPDSKHLTITELPPSLLAELDGSQP